MLGNPKGIARSCGDMRSFEGPSVFGGPHPCPRNGYNGPGRHCRRRRESGRGPRGDGRGCISERSLWRGRRRRRRKGRLRGRPRIRSVRAPSNMTMPSGRLVIAAHGAHPCAGRIVAVPAHADSESELELSGHPLRAVFPNRDELDPVGGIVLLLAGHLAGLAAQQNLSPYRRASVVMASS